MKKIIFVIFLGLLNLNFVDANSINNIEMDIFVDKSGSAFITEKWDVIGTDGSEWNKVLEKSYGMQLLDYKVYMDDIPLKYKNWNPDENLNGKKGYYGIDYTVEGKKLCFGKYDNRNHIFTISYRLSDFIYNTSNAQVLYFNFFTKPKNVNVENIQIDISGFNNFSNLLEIKSFGFRGKANIENSIISINYNKPKNNDYIDLIIKFPLNTFDKNNNYNNYKSYEELLDDALRKKKRIKYFYPFLNLINIFSKLFFIFFILLALYIFYINNKLKNHIDKLKNGDKC